MARAPVAPPLTGHVRHVGYVDPTKRRALYEGARLLVQPSFEEGFGMPVLEAMTLGVPVVAANRGSLPEVLGDAGLLVDPEQPADMAEAIQHILDDETFAAGCGARGVARAATFRWDQTARRVYDTYQQAIDSRGRKAALPSMRIGIDARELCGHATGVGRYLGGLLSRMVRPRRPGSRVRALCSRADRDDARLTPVPDSRCGRRGHLVGAGAAPRRHRDRSHRCLVLARLHRAASPGDSDRSSPSTICRSSRTRSGFDSRRHQAPLADEGIRGARIAVMTISQFSKRELIERLGVSAARIHVIPPGIDPGGSRAGGQHARDASCAPQGQTRPRFCSSARSSTAATSPT